MAPPPSNHKGVPLMVDDTEQQIWCGECNCYLHSRDRTDLQEESIVLVTCPCKRDPLGKCTGILKERSHEPGRQQ